MFLVNSRLSQLPVAPSPSVQDRKLLGHPFFRRYGVNLPSSLTEVRSFTWGEFPLPTGVGLRYGQNGIWLEAFLGGVGIDDFRPLSGARPNGHVEETRICLGLALPLGSPSCPFDGFTFLTASPHHSYDVFWCRILQPAFHRLRL